MDKYIVWYKYYDRRTGIEYVDCGLNLLTGAIIIVPQIKYSDHMRNLR